CCACCNAQPDPLVGETLWHWIPRRLSALQLGRRPARDAIRQRQSWHSRRLTDRASRWRERASGIFRGDRGRKIFIAVNSRPEKRFAPVAVGRTTGTLIRGGLCEVRYLLHDRDVRSPQRALAQTRSPC